MKVIATPRRGGKTAQLITRSATTDEIIVTKDYKTGLYTLQMARDMGVEIPRPITFEAFLDGRWRGRAIKGFLIDDVELLVMYMLRSTVGTGSNQCHDHINRRCLRACCSGGPMTSEIYEHRRNIKIDIYHHRRKPGEQPKCPICDKDITIEGGADMHEVFFTRGDVQGVDEKRLNFAIYHSCNVVLVHHGACHLSAQHTPYGKMRCIKQIVQYEGRNHILHFFDQMKSILKNPKDVNYHTERIQGYAPGYIEEPTTPPRWNFEN